MDDRDSLRERLLAPVAASAGVLYFLLLGGTPAGEQIATLRITNTLIGAWLIGYLVIRGVRFSDTTDRLVVGAAVLVALSAVVSPFPRQAVDALIGVVAYLALFLVARELMARPPWARGVVFGMRVMSVAVVLLAAVQIVPAGYEWWHLTGEIPPLRLPLNAGHWGHPYDLLMLGMMLAPSWFVPPRNHLARALGTVVPVLTGVVILLKGARAIWLAAGLATLASITLPLLGHARRFPARAVGMAALLVVLAAVALMLLGGPVAERLLTFATVGQRLEMWTAAIDAWGQRPLVGFGPNTFPWILQTTDYFQTNSIHPRHPDSAIFQLIPEMGVLGIAAAVLVLVAIGVPLVRSRQHLALWPLTAFVTAGMTANPTDFAYLVVVAILWAAYGLPRRSVELAIPPARWARAVTGTALGIVGVFVVATLVAGLMYDDAKRAAESGDPETARARLDTAVDLDPHMAIYWRQRGIANLLLGETDRAVADLERARGINPQDDVTWRALGIAQWENGDVYAAGDTLEQTVELQRSDPTNLLLLASWQAEARRIDDLRDTAAEIALGWPLITGAPGWSDLIEGIDGTTVVEDAMSRWRAGETSPEPIRRQLVVLAALDGRVGMIEQAATVTDESLALAQATAAVFQCDPEARSLLDAIPSSDRRSNTFWGLRIQHASQNGQSDETAMRLYRLIAAKKPTPEDWETQMNPLHENNPQGSVDLWGYDRSPIVWPVHVLPLPRPSAGESRWLLDPRGARAEAGMDALACG